MMLLDVGVTGSLSIGELSCNDGCVYKTRRNQYEAEFSPFS